MKNNGKANGKLEIIKIAVLILAIAALLTACLMFASARNAQASGNPDETLSADAPLAGAAGDSGETVTAESLFADTEFSFTNDAERPWIPETQNGKSILKTNIQGISNGKTEFTLTFNAAASSKLCIDYRVSSENYSDRFYLTLDGKAIPIYFNGDGKYMEHTSGDVPWTFITVDLPVGSHTLSVKYQKDNSTDGGKDACWITVPRICAADAVFNVTAKIEDPIYGSVTGSAANVKIGQTARFTVSENDVANKGFCGWFDDAGYLIGTNSELTFTVNQNLSLTARFGDFIDLTDLISVSYPGGTKQITEDTLIPLPAGQDTGNCQILFTNSSGSCEFFLSHNGSAVDVSGGSYSFAARGNYASDWLDITVSREGSPDTYVTVYFQKEFGSVCPDGSVSAFNVYSDGALLWAVKEYKGVPTACITDTTSGDDFLYLMVKGGAKKVLTFDWAVTKTVDSSTKFFLHDNGKDTETYFSPFDGAFRKAEVNIFEDRIYYFFLQFQIFQTNKGSAAYVKNIRTAHGDMNVSAAANNSELGSATSSVSGSVPVGTSVTVTADANAESVFTGWYDQTRAFVSADPKYTFTVTEDATLTAEFLKPIGTNTDADPLDFSEIVNKAETLSLDRNLNVNYAERRTTLYLKEIPNYTLLQDGMERTAQSGVYVLEIETDTTLTFRGEKTVVLDARFPDVGIGSIRRGYGTEEKPYIVEDAADLFLIKDYPDKFFKLANAMSYTGSPSNVSNGSEKTVVLDAVWTPIGTESNPFTGGFDGNGWKIIVKRVASADQGGMFGNVLNAKIQNFLLEITHTDGNSSFFGGIAGIAKGATTIQKVTVTVNFTDEVGSPAVFGGLIGNAVDDETNRTPTVTDCYVHGKIRNTGAGATAMNTGGLGNGGHYANCIVDAEIVANGLAGGLTGGYDKRNISFDNCWFAGVLTGTGESLINYPYVGIVNGYGALKTAITSQNSGQRLKIAYDHPDQVSKVEIFNTEFGETVTDGSCNIVLKTTVADTNLLDETKINGVTGNYGGFVVRFTMKDGTLKYVSTLDRSCFTFRSVIDVKLDELASYEDHFGSLAVDASKGTSPYSETGGVSIFGTVTVSNANDFEHLAWLVNGGIPATIGGKYYNARSITTLSVALGADIDLTADRTATIGGKPVFLNRKAGLSSGEKLNQFYGFGMSEMLPYRGSLFGEGHALTVDMNFPDSYLMGVIAIASDMSGTVEVKDLTVRGRIVGKNRVGLVGMFDGYKRSGSIRFSGVKMLADVTAAGNRVAAFLGEIHAAPIVFENCEAGSIITGGIAGVFLGGNTHGYSAAPGWTFVGTNYNGTNLRAIYGESRYSGVISDETVKRRVVVRYGENDDEFGAVEISNAEDTATISSILQSGITYAFGAPVTFSVFENGAFCGNEFFVFVFKGSLTKPYDGSADFDFGSENYLGNWSGATGTLTVSDANASETAFTAFSTSFVPTNGAVAVFAGLNATIVKRSVSIGIEAPSEIVYNGKSQPLTVTTDNFVGDAASQYTVVYYASKSGGVDTPYAADDYTVTVTVKDEFLRNYDLGAASVLQKSFKVKPLKLTVTMPDGYATQKSYGAAEPVWSALIADGAETFPGIRERVSVLFSRKDFETNQDVDVYPDAVAVSVSDKNYEVALSAPVTFTIVKAQPVVTLDGSSRPYDGMPFDMTGASVTGAGATQPSGAVSYRFYSDAACETEISVPSDAGNYYVKAFFAGDDRYLAGESEAAAITIAKAEPTIGVKASAAKIYKGQALSESVVTGGFVGIGGEVVSGSWSWRGADEIPAETQTYTAVFAPDSSNYNGTEVSLTVIVEQLTVKFEGVEPKYPIDYGATFSLKDFPVVPEKPGYSGVWSQTEDIVNIVEPKTVKASYELILYRLTYTLDGGTAVNPETYTIETKSFLLTAPTKEGHTFIGWTYESVTEPNPTAFVEKGSTGDKTFTAHYTVNRYAVTFTAIHGKISATPEIASGDRVAFGDTVSLSSLAGEGYKFAGWYLDGSEIENSDSYIFTVPAKNSAIEARFAALTDTKYTVKRFKQNLDGKTYGEPELELLYGETGATVTAEAKNYDGFTPPASMPTGIITGDGGLTLNVHYTRNRYDVRFDGGTPRSYPFGQTIKLSEPEKKGFRFDGWKTAGSETLFKGDFTVPSSDTAFTSVYTLELPEIAVSGFTSPVTYGTTVTLKATATHALPVVCQWYRDGGLMENETGKELVLTEVADSGTYSVKVAVTAEDQTTSAESAPVVVEIQPAEMSVTAAAYNAQYDGAAHGITVTAPERATTEYSLDETNWSGVNPTYTVPTETVTVYYRVSKINFKTMKGNATVTISKRKVSAELLSQSSEYDGNEPDVDQTKYRISKGTVIGGDDLKISITKKLGSGAGDYALSSTYDNDRYEVDFAKEAKPPLFTIKPRALKIELSPQSAPYDGTEPTHDQTMYQITSGSLAMGEHLILTLSKARGVNAQAYAITATWEIRNDDGSCAEASNYEIEVTTANFTITPIPLTVTIDDQTTVYSEKSADLTYRLDGTIVAGEDLPFTLSLFDQNGNLADPLTADAGVYQIVGTSLSGNYTMTFVPKNGSDKAVYTVAKKAVSVAGVTFEDTSPNGRIEVQTDGNNHQPQPRDLPEGVTAVYTTADGSAFSGAKSGTRLLTIKFLADSNHEITNGATEKTIKFALIAARGKITWNLESRYEYTGADQSGKISAVFTYPEGGSDKRLELTFENGSLQSVDGSVFQNAGTYTIHAVVPELYGLTSDSEPNRTVVMEKRVLDVSNVVFEPSSRPYTGKTQKITVKETLPEGAAVRYTLDGADYVGATDAGSYMVTAELYLTDEKNNTFADNKKVIALTAVQTITEIADAEQAFRDAVASIGDVGIGSYEAIADALDLYFALTFQGNVTEAKIALDQAVAAYNEAVRSVNDAHAEAAEICGAPIAMGLNSAGMILTLMALGFAIKRRLL